MKKFLYAYLVALSLLIQDCCAHEMSLAELQLQELSPGDFIWHWAPSERGPVDTALIPVWPETCQVEGSALRCGKGGLKGPLTIKGVGERYSAALVKVNWYDGRSRIYTLTAGQPRVYLYGSAEDQRDFGEIASSYTVLGIEHILTGIDHQFFVLGLLFLVGFNRQLLWTITAFTVAHSVTLAVSTLGWLTLRSPPVEATIALSIVLVAGEALHNQKTLARRWPALVAFLFGLVHGLGFAGALEDVGLPEQHLLAALLTFNLGVEIGQLLIVAVAWGIWRLTSYWPKLALARKAVLYGIGTVAAFWSWERIVLIFV